MPRGKKFTAEQIIGKLREAEVEMASGLSDHVWTIKELIERAGE